MNENNIIGAVFREYLTFLHKLARYVLNSAVKLRPLNDTRTHDRLRGLCFVQFSRKIRSSIIFRIKFNLQ